MDATPTPSITMARSMPQEVETLKEMSPFDLFRSQMETGFVETKVDAMKRMSIVAFAMGPETALGMLVPYLASLKNQEDEVLLAMAVQIQSLVPSLLSKTQTLPLLPILERLAAVEETVVRTQAVKTICHVSDEIPDPAVLVGMAKRLASSDWFTPKVSAAGMLPTLLKRGNHTSELVLLFKELAQDDAPMVRRSAAANLGEFMANLDDLKLLHETIVPILQTLAKDEQDSVRLLAVASVGQAGNSLDKDLSVQVVVPIIKAGATDQSWRVRHNLAKQYSNVASNLVIDIDTSSKTLVMACFDALLQDVEAEVRAAAVSHLARMVHWGGPDLFQSHILPLLAPLADDVVMEVRSKTALALMDASEGGTLSDEVIVSSFGHLLENFLQDEFPEVQLHVLGNLHRISHLLDKMQGVISAILGMVKAANWRVRESVARLLPHVVEARGTDFFSSVLLEPAWLTLLLDPVASVRLAIVEGMARLVKAAGPDYVQQQVVPRHDAIFEQHSESYLVRMTILKAHVETALVSEGEFWMAEVNWILGTLQDKVPNVRMAAAKGLVEIVSTANKNDDYVKQKVMPALQQTLTEETDEDCRHFEQVAMEVVSN